MQSKKMAEAIFNLQISPTDEEKYFIGNKKFYKIIHGYLRKIISQPPPFKSKRNIIPFIQGKVKPYAVIFSIAARMYPKYYKEIVLQNPEKYKKALGLIREIK
jgi:hypothetical protein